MSKSKRSAADAAKKDTLPRHIAVIMDGNGRWANARGLQRTKGHDEGAKSVREITTECAERGIEWLTLYAFSSENWRRPKTEVSFLMRLLRRFLISERQELMKNNIKLVAIGRLDELPAPVRAELEKSMQATRDNTAMTLCLALNYGGRAEIIDATRKMIQEVQKGRLDPAQIGEDTFRRYMYDPDMPDPDLLIRTGGEMRVSNFLLWGISYAELWITPVCWPAFRKEHLEEALQAYARRQRRFGGVPKHLLRRLVRKTPAIAG